MVNSPGEGYGCCEKEESVLYGRETRGNVMTVPPVTGSYDRDIGALQATVTMLASDMKDQASVHERMMRQQREQYISLIADFKDMVEGANVQILELKKEILQMKSMVDQAKGGWKIIVGVGTLSATFGAIMTKLFPFLSGLPK